MSNLARITFLGCILATSMISPTQAQSSGDPMIDRAIRDRQDRSRQIDLPSIYSPSKSNESIVVPVIGTLCIVAGGIGTVLLIKKKAKLRSEHLKLSTVESDDSAQSS